MVLDEGERTIQSGLVGGKGEEKRGGAHPRVIAKKRRAVDFVIPFC